MWITHSQIHSTPHDFIILIILKLKINYCKHYHQPSHAALCCNVVRSTIQAIRGTQIDWLTVMKFQSACLMYNGCSGPLQNASATFEHYRSDHGQQEQNSIKSVHLTGRQQHRNNVMRLPNIVSVGNRFPPANALRLHGYRCKWITWAMARPQNDVRETV